MAFTENSQEIDMLYNTIITTKPLTNEYAVVFVYNEDSLIEDEEHSSECITSIEKDMIMNSFRKSAEYVYASAIILPRFSSVCNVAVAELSTKAISLVHNT